MKVGSLSLAIYYFLAVLYQATLFKTHHLNAFCELRSRPQCVLTEQACPFEH